MTRCRQVTVATIMALIAVPALILHAQSEDTAEAQVVGEPAVTEEATVAGVDGESVDEETSAIVPIEEPSTTEGDDSVVEEDSNALAAEGASGQPAAEEGAAAAVSKEAGQAAASAPETSEEAVAGGVTEIETVLASEPIGEAVASSTASSTLSEGPPPAPQEDPYVLQPAVELSIDESGLTAEITVENLTCRMCDKMFPAVRVEVYYTEWYPNDGPELAGVGSRLAEQAFTSSELAPWAGQTISWSANRPEPGRYYFVVVVDPQNELGAYRLFRSEFSL